MNNKKRKISIIAGSRGEYGYYRPIIREIEKRKNLDYGLIVTNMHLLDTFGRSIDQIKKDGIKIDATVYNTFDGYNHATMVKSLGVFMMQLPEILESSGADIILIAGDRGEQMTAAMVGAHMYIPVAHIQAGEVSGNIDGITRHAITKYSHIHFTSNEDAAERVLKMGEESHRVHNVGAPMLDELVMGKITPKDEIIKKYNLRRDKPTMIFVFHSVTEEMEQISQKIDEILGIITTKDLNIVVILNNSDAGSRLVRKKIYEHRKPNIQIHHNVLREDYAGLLSIANVLVGNSSSGLLEAPTFKLPVVNIGNRQYGRVRSKNVIDVGYSGKEVNDAIDRAMSDDFVKSLHDCTNPYGDGKSSIKVVDVLEHLKIDDKLLVKKITY